MKLLYVLAKSLADPAVQTMNKLSDKVGLGLVLTGGAAATAENMEVMERGLHLSTWVQVVALAGGLLYIIKLIMEIYLLRLQRKAVKEEDKEP